MFIARKFYGGRKNIRDYEVLLSPMMYKMIIIKSDFTSKLGLKKYRDAVDPAEIYNIIGEANADYYIIVPDILYPYKRDILRIAEEFRDNDMVIVIGKPRSPFSRLLLTLSKSPIPLKNSKLQSSLAVIIRKDLVQKINNVTSLDDLLEGATRIAEVLYDVPLYDYVLTIYGRLPKTFLIALHEPLRIIKFGLVGFSGAIVNLGTIQFLSTHYPALLTSPLGLFLMAYTGFEISLSWNFILHELWTFRDLELERGLLSRIKRWLKYHVASLGSLLAQSATIGLLTGLLHFEVIVSAAFGILAGFVLNYLIGRFYTWKK